MHTGKASFGVGEQIDQAIFHSVLRASLALPQSPDSQTYLDTVNAYFDCTATPMDNVGYDV